MSLTVEAIGPRSGAYHSGLATVVSAFSMIPATASMTRDALAFPALLVLKFFRISQIEMLFASLHSYASDFFQEAFQYFGFFWRQIWFRNAKKAKPKLGLFVG
jgi:hypothetical protein